MRLLLVAAVAATAPRGDAPQVLCPSKAEVTTPVAHGCSLFHEFEQKFERAYVSAKERAWRYLVFLENYARIQYFQKNDASATYSYLTPFADWTVAEFQKRNNLKVKFETFKHKTLPNEKFSNDTLPKSFDWRDKGVVNPVKNQGQCGSCWAFSTVANIEGVNAAANGKLWSLSEQELVSCDDNGDQGCNGGLMNQAYEWMINNGQGLETESDYPYQAYDTSCSLDKKKEHVYVQDWFAVPQKNEVAMAETLVKYGTLSVALNANAMMYYFGGISDPYSFLCDPTGLDHGVAIVGYNETSKPYWIIRNSWGPSWGESGYYLLVRGKGACGIDLAAMTVTKTSSEARVGLPPPPMDQEVEFQM
jgi:cathepsin F